MNNKIFEHKSPDFAALLAYGFVKKDDGFYYGEQICDGQFELRVRVSAADGGIRTETVDLAADEPYTLHLVDEAQGAFVGAVRAEYERVLKDIAEKCFFREVFKSEASRKTIAYVREKYGCELEFLWKDTPDAVWRRKDNDKWFGVLLVLKRDKLKLTGDDAIEILDLRADPEEIAALADGERYFAGYHMNKKHWLTVLLDGSVPVEEIIPRLDKSYDLAKKK